MSIQVEMPKWIAMESNGEWYAYPSKPKIRDNVILCGWVCDSGTYVHINVTGFQGKWEDSVHHWTGTEWEKVK